jgi:hypothetical protein
MLKRFRNNRSLALLPAIAWLTMQLMMTGVLSSAKASTGTDRNSLVTVICTADGLKFVDSAGNPVAPTNLPSEKCEWCKAFGTSAPVKGPLTVVTVSFNIEARCFHRPENEIIESRFVDTISAIRAPPL